MRESALFLLGLLVAVSVDVARLLVYVDLCARASASSDDGMYGASRPKRGAMGFIGGIRASMDLFFRHADRKITSISGNDTILPPGSIYATCGVSYTRISIRRPLLSAKARFRIAGYR